MSIKRTIIAAVVGLTLVALVAPGVAQGVTIEELLAQIAQLQAQLIALQQAQGGTGITTGTIPANCVGVTFTRALVNGSTGSDVKCLQSILNLSATTRVAATGAGSPGGETSYFGPLTLAALRIYHAEHGWTPANQAGPLTRGALNAFLASGTPVTPVTPGTPVIPTGSGLTVQLASTNPISGTIVDGQGQFPLARLTFTNGDNAEVTVTGLKVKRIGVSADASLTNVYLFNGATRLTDGASVSSTIITFNDTAGLFKVPVGGTVIITVTADVDGTAGETAGVRLVAATDVTTNASSVNGTFPLTSNLHTIATGTLASVSFNTATTPAAASIDPQDDYTVFQNSVTVGTRAVNMTRISLRKTGSVSNTDLQNFRLYIDGVQVGSTIQLDSNGYLTFDLTSSPKKLEAGTRVVKVLADIIGGSNLNFTMNLWNVADATFVDSQYDANVLVQANSTTFSKRSTGQQSVNSGTLTVTKMTDSPSGDIVDGATNATLAKFQLKAAGEKVKIETLYVSAVVSTTAVGYLRNGALYANGVQIGSTSNLYDTTNTSPYYTTFSLGSSLIVEPGSPVTLEVRADVYDNDGTNSVTTGTTIQITVEDIGGSTGNNNGTGQTSAATIDVPATDVTANTLTVAQGGLTLSQLPSFTAQTVVAPLTAQKIAHFTLAANTTEDVNVTAINVTANAVVSTYGSNLYVVYGGVTSSTKATIAASNSWSINYNLPAGQSIDLIVYSDFNSSSSGTAIATVDADGTTVSSAVTADSSGTVAGQSIVFSSGAFAGAFASTPQNQIVAGAQEVEIGRWKFTSSYQEYTIKEIKIDPDIGANSSDNSEAGIDSVSLKDGSTVLATQSFNAVNTTGSTGGYYFTGLSVKVPASTSKTLTVVATITIPSATAGNSGLRIQPSLTYVKEMNPQGTTSTAIDNTTSSNKADANSTYVYRTIPTITKEALTSTTLINGAAVDLFKFRVAAPSQGDVFIKQFKIDLSWTDGGGATDNLELESLKLYKDGVDITTVVTIQDEDLGLSAEDTTGVTEGNANIIVVWDGATEDTISAGSSTVYTIRGTPQGFNVTDAATYAGSDSVSLTFNADAADVTFGSTTVDYIGYINTDSTDQVGSILSLYTSATASTSAEAANMIWSDGSAVAHSSSTTAGTGDWTNSYLLQSLTPQAWAD